MTDGGFLTPRRPEPVKLGLVVAAHAAAITALMLAVNPKVAHEIDSFTGYNVPADKTPPPKHEVTKAPPRTTTPEQLTVVTPQVTPPVDPTAQTTVITLAPPIQFIPGPEVTPIAPPPPLVAVPVLTEATVDPRFADALQPAYPPALMREGVAGSVTVRVLVGPDGRVRQVELVRADDPAFFAATERQALRAWRFVPATRDGVAVASWRTMTAHFVMQ